MRENVVCRCVGCCEDKRASVDIPSGASFDMICDTPDTGKHCWVTSTECTGVSIDNTPAPPDTQITRSSCTETG